MKALVAKYPNNCYPMIGLHPSSVDSDWENQLNIIQSEKLSANYIAIGEIGIDLYWSKEFIKEQTSVFRELVIWAKKEGLPIVIHARDSFDEIFNVLDDLNDSSLTGIFHCFTGNLFQAEKIIEYGGFKMGVGGVLTYKNSGLGDTLSEVQLEHLVLETDSPYLPPVPYRGKRNESSYVLHIAEKLAGLHGITLKEVEEETTRNAYEIFKLPKNQ